MTDRCVCCGEIIPEGRQVCPTCEQKECLHVWVFDGIIERKGMHAIKMKCSVCGARRTDLPVARIPVDEDGKRYTGLLEED